MIIPQETLNSIFEGALTRYSQGDYYPLLLEAKDAYFGLTGETRDDDEEYEHRMGLFNEWYLFDFQSPRFSSKIIYDYLHSEGHSEEIVESMRTIELSLFEFLGENMRGQQVVRDLILGKKLQLAPAYPKIPLHKGDLFLARRIVFKGEYYLFAGMRTLPSSALGVLKKQIKRTKKLNQSIPEFLSRVEALKTKWVRYGFVDPLKIFVFEK